MTSRWEINFVVVLIVCYPIGVTEQKLAFVNFKKVGCYVMLVVLGLLALTFQFLTRVSRA